MPIRFNQLFNLSEQDLDEKGIFNGFIDIDAKFHVDPSLLKTSQEPELSEAYQRFQEHFKQVIFLVENSKVKGDRLWREALQRLHFKEKPYIMLGYSVGDNHGSAIGKKIAGQLLETTKELVAVGIKDPVIFELIGLFEEGVGADRISDMAISVIFNDLVKYTQRVAKELNIKFTEFKRGDETVLLPMNPRNRKPIIFVPKDILRTLPIAYSWDEIDHVASYNQSLRLKVNRIIGNTWKTATSSKVRKRDFKETLVKHPELINDLIGQYNKKPRVAYDFDKDPSGEIVWASAAENITARHPINLRDLYPITSQNIFEVVKRICQQYEHLIENNGLWELLYNDDAKLRNERFAQKLFYGVADSYCKANDLDLSREPNAGSGALDFKISRGYDAKVTVEVKYSSNTSLIKGYEKQLPTYNKAERADESIYLVLQTTASDASIKRLLKIVNGRKTRKEASPEVIIIDAARKSSASKKR